MEEAGQASPVPPGLLNPVPAQRARRPPHRDLVRSVTIGGITRFLAMAQAANALVRISTDQREGTAMSRIGVAGGTGLVGRHVVEALGRRGHEAVILARRYGVDLVTGSGAPRSQVLQLAGRCAVERVVRNGEAGLPAAGRADLKAEVDLPQGVR